jgi:hypothetical protein
MSHAHAATLEHTYQRQASALWNAAFGSTFTSISFLTMRETFPSQLFSVLYFETASLTRMSSNWNRASMRLGFRRLCTGPIMLQPMKSMSMLAHLHDGEESSSISHSFTRSVKAFSAIVNDSVVLPA